MEYVAPLNEIVNLLDKHGGRILSRLRERLPSEHGRLTIGLTLGGDEASTKIDAEICLAGLQIAIRVCRTGAHHLRRRLKITNGFGLAGQLLTATAGASIFGVVAADAPKATQYGVGIVALFGALITITSEFFAKLRGAYSAADTFAKLNSNAYECALVEASLAGRLRQRGKTQEDRNEIHRLVARGNELSHEVVKLASLAGVGNLDSSESDEVLATLDLQVGTAKLNSRGGEAAPPALPPLAITGDQ